MSPPGIWFQDLCPGVRTAGDKGECSGSEVLSDSVIGVLCINIWFQELIKLSPGFDLEHLTGVHFVNIIQIPVINVFDR
jgi:hypothetical protein